MDYCELDEIAANSLYSGIFDMGYGGVMGQLSICTGSTKSFLAFTDNLTGCPWPAWGWLIRLKIVHLSPNNVKVRVLYLAVAWV